MIKKKKKRLRPSKKENRIEGSVDQSKERKKKEKWRRKQHLRPSKVALTSWLSKSRSGS